MSTKEQQGLDLEGLEGMVDRHAMSGVLEMLAKIAAEKAEHVHTNWQDKTLSKSWEQRMLLLDITVTRMLKLER